MNGLGIYRSYRRLKDEQELLSPTSVEKPKSDFPPEAMDRYMQLRKLIEEQQKTK